MEQKLRRDRNIGSNLKVLRETHNISQEKLCALLQRRGCDIGRSTYAKYENGELNIKISVLIELRKIYDCTYDDFFEGLDIQEWFTPYDTVIALCGGQISHLKPWVLYSADTFSLRFARL